MKTLIEKIVKIQNGLKVPKNQYNSFAKFHYRACEDILEALTPLLAEAKLALIISDNIVNVNNRYYVKATIKITDGEHTIENSALAREEENKKGMDGAQVTGAASSYARKYALNGMFCIDDTKDSDIPTKDEYKQDLPLYEFAKKLDTTKIEENVKEMLVENFRNGDIKYRGIRVKWLNKAILDNKIEEYLKAEGI